MSFIDRYVYIISTYNFIANKQNYTTYTISELKQEPTIIMTLS